MKLPEKIGRLPDTFAHVGRAVNSLIDLARPWTRVLGKNGIRVTVAEGNVIIDGKDLQNQGDGGSDGTGSTYYHPFKVVPVSAFSNEVSILPESRLFSALSTPVTITALTTPITLAATTKIWLKGTVASYEITGASITIVNPANPVTYASGAQTEFHLLIGSVSSGFNENAPGFDFTIGGSEYHFEQMLNTHLLLRLICNDGQPALYPLAYAGY
jgi:hypothetical protein